MKPSERIDQLRDNGRKTMADAIIAYLDGQQLDRPCPPDERDATVHPIAGGQLSPNHEAPRYGHAFPGRLAPDVYTNQPSYKRIDDNPDRCAESCSYPVESEGRCRKCGCHMRFDPRLTEHLTTMPRDYDHGMASKSAWEAQESDARATRELTETQVLLLAATNQRDEAIERARGLQAGNASLRAQLDMWQDTTRKIEKERNEAQAELTLAKADFANACDVGRRLEAELTRLKEENATLREALETTAVVAREQVAASWGLSDEKAARDARLAVVRSLEAQRDDARAELDKERAAHGETRRLLAAVRDDLTWERGWDLLRKAQTGAVVDAARDVVASFDAGLVTSSGATISRVRAALSALDAPAEPVSEPYRLEQGTATKPLPSVGDTVRVNWVTSQMHGRIGKLARIDRATEARHEWVGAVDFGDGMSPMPFGPCLDVVNPEPPAERPILAGSKWRNLDTGDVRTVIDSTETIWFDAYICWMPDRFRAAHEWVSDPPAEEPKP